MAGATPIEGEILMIATVKGSIGPRVANLVERVQAHLGSRIDDYRQQYEVVHEVGGRAVFLAERGHWGQIGDRLGLHEREIDAIRRAHAEQFEVIGRREGRESEFEAALEIRDPVVVATD